MTRSRRGLGRSGRLTHCHGRGEHQEVISDERHGEVHEGEKEHGARRLVLDEDPDVRCPQHQRHGDRHAKEYDAGCSEVSRGDVPRHAGSRDADNAERAVVPKAEMRVVLK